MSILRRYRRRLAASPPIRFLDQFSRDARLFLLGTVIGGITFTGFQLFFNIYLRSRGFDLDFIGVLNAIPSGAALLAGVPMGMLSDRIGPRRAMLAGLGIATLAGSALVTARTPFVMIA